MPALLIPIALAARFFKMTSTLQAHKTLLAQLDWDNPIIQRAVTHRSRSTDHYERLEFLGDAVLSLVIAEYLFKAFPDQDEGWLSRARTYLVRKETLMTVAHDLGVSDYLCVGKGESANGGRYKSSIVADAVEALIGACYLVEGLQPTRDFIEQAFTTPLEEIRKIGPSLERLKDPKSLLQEYLQSRGLSLPIYEVLEHKQDSHIGVSCRVESLDIKITATAPNRRQAEQQAADKILQFIYSSA